MNWTGHAGCTCVSRWIAEWAKYINISFVLKPVIIGMMDHKNTRRRKLETEEVHGSSTPVLRGSRKGRVRPVLEFGERWLNQCSYPTWLSFPSATCHASLILFRSLDFLYTLCLVLIGNGAWDDDDDWFCRLHLLFGWRKEGEERDGFSWNCKKQLHTAHVIASAYTRNISNSGKRHYELDPYTATGLDGRLVMIKN
ncbi:hypothetical protein POTOM_010030 [Populus tomentosa]|uniref:Uncharacterized protein n=1 Tax=Populus tomentosa TaxID=118781 RepID=A0A8X8DC72_POPTO|nr:hypothetical protein POTOM_010030 [Populus tomentosa]